MDDYLRDPEEIYRKSFAIVREEADLSALPPAMEPVAVRLIHACGMVDIVSGLSFSSGAAEAARAALSSRA
ncbi:MAG: precorrin-8X methylmutase, partial [Rhodospirillales bacterium]|nr:precorrin-8X methylmutase [Rhodospirillales bacterium]MCW8861660.1 precorrin-8X methylmutase [Rhodospirillales bacterium]MCW8952751.1 precorrin-8X methylmutase [Rhodospirillales bacterium]